MTTFDWISLLGILVGGFWALMQKLSNIETALVGKVSFDDCSKKRDRCICMNELRKPKERGER